MLIESRTVWLVNIQTDGFFITNFSMSAEYHRKQALYHSVSKRKVLQMQPSDKAHDIMLRSYVSLKFAKRLNAKRSYGISPTSFKVLRHGWRTNLVLPN